MTDFDLPFDEWNTLKKKLHKKSQLKVFFSEREIWWCSLGKNVGHEQDGKNSYFERPVLIVRQFNLRIFLAIPLTTVIKDNKYYFKYIFRGREYSAILSQIRLLDRGRLQRKAGILDERNFMEIKKRIRMFI